MGCAQAPDRSSLARGAGARHAVPGRHGRMADLLLSRPGPGASADATAYREEDVTAYREEDATRPRDRGAGAAPGPPRRAADADAESAGAPRAWEAGLVLGAGAGSDLAPIFEDARSWLDEEGD